MRSNCPTCRDLGFVAIDGSKDPDAMKNFAGCSCKAGDPWRDLLAAVHDPPPCIDCGQPAECCLLSATPRCLPCERNRNRLRRSRGLPVEARSAD